MCGRGGALRGRGSRHPAEPARAARAPVPAAVPPDHAKLAHVPARLPVRPRLRHRDRGQRCSASRRRRRRKGVSIWSILVFPALFAAGMSLVDTTDGILMLRRLWLGVRQADAQALLQPDDHLRLRGGRRRWSAASRALGLVGDQLGLEGAFWDGIGALNDNFNTLGFVIIGVFVVSWVALHRHLPLARLRPDGD